MNTSTRRHVAFVVSLSTVVAMSGYLLNAAPPQAVGTWEVRGTTDPSSARTGAATATLANGSTLIAGGRLGDGSVTDSVVVYDPMTNESTVVGYLVSPRVNAAAARLDDGRVLVAGGEVGELLSADVEIFDPSTGTSSAAPSLTVPRTRHAAARLADGKVLIVGGVTVDGVVLATTELFDPATGNMLAAGSMATPRSAASATLLIDNRVLVAGGNDGTQDLASAELFYPETQEFFPVDTPLSQARAGHTAVLLPHNGAVLIAGGTVAGAPVNTVDLFLPTMFPDPYTWSMGTFGPAEHLTHARTRAVSGPMGDNGYAFVAGGGAAEGEAYAFVTLKTDKDDYAPGQAALITGSGWQPGEEVTLVFQEDPAVHPDYTLTLTADGEGNISHDQWAPEEHDLNVRFYLMATGVTSQRRAQVTFTDAKSTSTVLTSNNNPSDFGESVTFTAAVTCTNTPCVFSTTSAPLHAVTFRDGGGNCNQGTPLSSAITVTVLSSTTATASFTTSTLSVGSHVVKACFDGPNSGNNAGASDATVTQVVNQATVTPTLSVTNSPATYNGTLQAAAVSGSVAGTVSDVKYNGSSTVPTNAGTYAVTADFVPSDTSTYSSLSDAAAGNFVIGQATSTTTVTIVGGPFTYTGSPLMPATVTVTGAGGLNLTPAANYGNNTDAGMATASYTFAGDANHTGSSDSKNFTIGKASSTTTVTIGVGPFVYNGAAYTPATVTVTGPGALSLTPTAVYVNNVNAGTATASYTFAGDANHTGSGDSKTFTIDKAPSTTTVAIGVGPFVYNGAAHTPATVTVTGAGGLNLTSTADYADNTNAGTATASYTFAGDANHIGSSDSKTFTIDKASSTTTVTIVGGPFTYTGSPLTPATVTVTGAGGLNLTPAANYGDNTDAGTATASYTFAGDANHTGSADSKTFTIDKATSTTTVTIVGGPFTYTGSPLTPATVSVTGAGGLNLTPTANYGNNTDAGMATASYTFAGDANHTGSSDSTTFAIGQATSTTTVTIVGGPFTYTGSPLTPATVTVTGAGGLNLTPAANYGNNTDAGTATASYTFAGDANHTGSGDSKTFTIDKAPSTTTVAIGVGPFVYNGAAHTPATVTVTGAGGLNLTPTADYANNTNAGTATASYTFAGDANHIGSGDSKTFTIDKAPSTTTVAIGVGPFVYNGAAHTPATVTVTGPGGLNLTPTADYANNTDAGTATASYTFAGDANHIGSGDSKTFTIDKAPSTTTVAIGVGPFTYAGSPLTPATVSVTGAGGLNLTPTADYVNNTNAGTATASYTFAGDANHTGSSDSKNFTIGKASSTTVTVGAGPFTFDGTTHMGGSGTVTGAGGLSTSATSLTYTGDQVNAGTYYVTAHYAGDANHDPSDGAAVAIVINKASSVTTTVGDGPFTYDGSTHAGGSGTVTGAGGLSTSATSLTYTGDQVNAGTYYVTAHYAGDANHDPSDGAAVAIVINKAASVTTTVGDGPFTYDGSTHAGGSGTVSGAGGLSTAATSLTYTGDQVNAGTYYVTAHYAGDANHDPSDGAAVAIVINKATSVTTTVGDGPFTYDGSTHAGGSGTVTGAGGLSTSATSLTYTGDQVNAGTYYVTAHYAGDANHDPSDGAAVAIVINKASSVTTTVGDGPFTYDGSTHAGGSGTVTGAGGLSTSATSLTYTGDQVNAGTYYVTAHYAGDANHDPSDGAAVAIVINKAASVTTTVGDGPFTYDGSTHAGGSGTVSGAGGLSTAATSLTYTGDQVNAGTYYVTAHYAGDANHDPSDGAAVAIVINKASSVTTTVGDGPFTYDGSTHAGGSGTVTGAGGLSTSATSLTYTGDQVNAGTYYVTAHYAGDANHDPSDGAAVPIVINKAASVTTVTIVGGPFVYNGAPHTPATVLVTGAGGLNLTPTATYANNVNAGTATASYSFAGDANHTGSNDTENFAIGQRPATWTTNAAIKTLGALDPVPLTTGFGDFRAADGVSATYSRAAGEIVAGNPYHITATLSATGLLTNYAITNAGASFTIGYATTGMCFGSLGHQVLQPLNTDGSSVVKKGSTVPVKFRVCDVNGNSVGTPGVVTSFQLVQVINGLVTTLINEDPVSTTPDAEFRWSATDKQWIFNLNTKNLTNGKTYVYKITLNDGSSIDFQFGTKQ